MNTMLVSMTVLALEALALGASAQPPTAPQTPEWMAQKATRECFSNADGVLRISPCAGWVKTTQRQFEDFRFEFEARSLSAAADAALALFGITKPAHSKQDTAYGFSLLGGQLMPELVAPVRMMTMNVNAGRIAQTLKPAGEWQSYAISRHEDLLGLAINGLQIATVSCGVSLDGWIGFRVRGGDLEVRTTRVITEPSSSQPHILTRGGYRSKKGNGVTLPKLLHEERPNYTDAAIRAKIEGIVVIELVVDAEGRVTNPIVVRSLEDGYGLDQEALRVVTKWRFTPGTYEGKPVPIVVSVELSFTLR